MKKLLTLIKYLLMLPLYWLSYIIPKDKNLWVFGAWFGERYADNSKYLFEYVNKHHPEIKAVWLTKNKLVYKSLKDKGYRVLYKYSLKALGTALRSGVSIFCQSNSADNFAFLNNNRTKKIQLWHGIPLKKIGYDDTIFTFKEKHYLLSKIKRIFFPFSEERYDLVISTSEEVSNKLSSAFRVDIEKIKITGYPRNDIFFTKKINRKNQFIITYLPTFRGSPGDSIDLFLQYCFNYFVWEKTLKMMKAILLIKLHPVNKPSEKFLKLIQNSDVIILKKEIDVYQILGNTDILITDYSSIYFDYLLTNKPIIFTPFDIETYVKEDREFYYDYNQITPGPKCKNWDEVLEWIKKFRENPKLYEEERMRIRDIFHKYKDGRSSERVYNEILKLLS